MKMISLYSGVSASITTTVAATYVLVTCCIDHAKTAILITKRIVEVVPNRPFLIMVANISNSSLTLLKNTKLAELTNYPPFVGSMTDNYAEQVEPVTGIPVYREKVDKEN